MTRALPILLAVLALGPASATASTTQDRSIYAYGVDAYLVCVAEAGPGATQTAVDQIACANELALDLTDGGQLRRAPICLRNRTTEWVGGENNDPINTMTNCIEQYLGTRIDATPPRVTLPPIGG